MGIDDAISIKKGLASIICLSLRNYCSKVFSDKDNLDPDIKNLSGAARVIPQHIKEFTYFSFSSDKNNWERVEGGVVFYANPDLDSFVCDSPSLQHVEDKHLELLYAEHDPEFDIGNAINLWIFNPRYSKSLYRRDCIIIDFGYKNGNDGLFTLIVKCEYEYDKIVYYRIETSQMSTCHLNGRLILRDDTIGF